jgi:hypothetical protein
VFIAMGAINLIYSFYVGISHPFVRRNIILNTLLLLPSITFYLLGSIKWKFLVGVLIFSVALNLVMYLAPLIRYRKRDISYGEKLLLSHTKELERNRKERDLYTDYFLSDKMRPYTYLIYLGFLAYTFAGSLGKYQATHQKDFLTFNRNNKDYIVIYNTNDLMTAIRIDKGNAKVQNEVLILQDRNMELTKATFKKLDLGEVENK